MRHSRLKPAGIDTFMHVYNRTVGSTGEFPFGNMEKGEFLRRLKELTEFYVIDVVAFQCMGNHFHAILRIPGNPPSNEQAAKRYRKYYNGKRRMDPESRACSKLALRLRDVSEFMRDLQQPFTRWFNRTRPHRRRGHLWADRFKNTVLEYVLAVWDCWKYIEMNPVRARMVMNPADYRFCSFGEWAATGSHPFEEVIERHLMPVFRSLLRVETMDELEDTLKREFARMKAVNERRRADEIETAIAVAAEKEAFSTRLDRRVRYWVDGLVIGSELFVRNTIVGARGALALKKRKFTRAVNTDGKEAFLFCFKQLRVLLE